MGKKITDENHREHMTWGYLPGRTIRILLIFRGKHPLIKIELCKIALCTWKPENVWLRHVVKLWIEQSLELMLSHNRLVSYYVFVLVYSGGIDKTNNLIHA